MSWGYILVGLLVALALSGLLGLYMKSRIAWNRYWALFLIVAMAAWLGGFWVIPLGLGYWTVYLLLFMAVAVTFGFLLSAAAQNNPEEPRMTQEEMRGPEGTRAAVGISVGVVLALLVVLLGSRYLYQLTV